MAEARSFLLQGQRFFRAIPAGVASRSTCGSLSEYVYACVYIPIRSYLSLLQIAAKAAALKGSSPIRMEGACHLSHLQLIGPFATFAG